MTPQFIHYVTLAGTSAALFLIAAILTIRGTPSDPPLCHPLSVASPTNTPTPLLNGCSGGVCDLDVILLWLDPLHVPTPTAYMTVLVDALYRAPGLTLHSLTVISLGVHSAVRQQLSLDIQTALYRTTSRNVDNRVATRVSVVNLPLSNPLPPSSAILTHAISILPAILANSSGTHTLLMTPRHVPRSPTDFLTLLAAPFANPVVEIAGCSVYQGTDVLHHGYEVKRGGGNLVTLSPIYSGFPIRDARLQSGGPVHAVSPQCMLFSRRTSWLKQEVLLPLGPPSDFEDTAAMRLMIPLPPGAVVVVPAQVELLDSRTNQGTPRDVSITQDNSPVLLSPDHIEVIWALFCCRCCGFSNEAIHLMQPLEKHVRVRTTAGRDCHCDGFPSSVIDFVDRVLIDPGSKHIARRSTVVWVSHGDPFFITSSQLSWSSYVTPDYVVGRVMYEFTRIPDIWVRECNRADVDELWVPSKFVRQIFEDSGVEPSKIVVMPEGMDTFYYDPEAHDSIDLQNDVTKHFKRVYQNRVLSPTEPPYYKFLSVFKWEDRKGWDILLDAYFSSFRIWNHVSLYILTHVWYPGAADTGTQRNPHYIAKIIYNFLETKHATNNATFPHFVIVCDLMTEKDVATVFNSVDAFVLPTRGEGWGLPVMQAMSMALPTISTAWGGTMDFTTPETTYLIDIEGIEDIPPWSYYEYVPGKKWAMPSVTHLGYLMEEVLYNPAVAAHKGQLARKHIVENFDDEVVAKKYSTRLHEIAAIVNERKRNEYSRPIVTPVPPKSAAPGESPPPPQSPKIALHDMNLSEDQDVPSIFTVVSIFLFTFVMTARVILFFNTRNRVKSTSQTNFEKEN